MKLNHKEKHIVKLALEIAANQFDIDKQVWVEEKNDRLVLQFAMQAKEARDLIEKIENDTSNDS